VIPDAERNIMNKENDIHMVLILLSSIMFALGIALGGILDIENLSETQIQMAQAKCTYRIGISIAIYMIFNSLVFAHKLKRMSNSSRVSEESAQPPE